MNRFTKIILCSSLCLLATQSAWAFRIKKITFKGLQRVSRTTALSYLPVSMGENITDDKTSQIIQALYKTGFFTDIKLLRQDDTLIVDVTERPTIYDVNVTGNDDIPQDKLNDALKKMGLARGEVFQRSVLNQAKQALVNQYYGGGYYNAKVTANVTKESRNRVSVNIDVSEGRIAKIEGIKIVGNHVFDENTLLNQLTMTTPGFLTIFNGKDKYSSDALMKSVDALKDYYLNNGYLKMRVNSQQVTITPDRKYVYIVIDVTEGAQYKFGKYSIKGDTVLPKSELNKFISVTPGGVFSRQKVIDTDNALGRRLQDAGYAYAKVEAIPHVDEKNKTVDLTFDVNAGSRYYVRRITFDGNTETSNIALRNYFTQMQDSQYSRSKLEMSERNLRQLPYLQEQQLSYGLHAVPGTNNELDVNMKVQEALSAQFQFNIGYSQAEKFMISTSVNQQNFLGTGKTVGVNLQVSGYSKVYSISYVNPFYTANGISHSVSAYIQKVNANSANIADFSTSSYGFSSSFGFPLSNYDSFSLGYGLRHTHLQLGSSPSLDMLAFDSEHGDQFDQLLLTAGWHHNSTDRYKLPTSGMIQGLTGVVSVPVNKNKLQYYTISYDNRLYVPLNKAHDWIFTTLLNVGYGNGYGSFKQLPFFNNFYAGGLGVQGQVRGYDVNSLGPVDSSGNTIGGNELLTGSIGLIVPNPAEDHGVRTTLFFDAGNVYNTDVAPVNLSQLRYSAGLQVKWWTPLGIPLVFSFAKAIHTQPNDVTDTFQFSLGGSI